MARFLLVNRSTNIVENVIELDPSNYTTAFTVDINGNKIACSPNANNVMIPAPGKYLVPQGYMVYQSDIQNVSDTYTPTNI